MKNPEPNNLSVPSKKNTMILIIVLVVITAVVIVFKFGFNGQRKAKKHALTPEQKKDYIEYIDSKNIPAPTSKEISSFVDRSKKYNQLAQ